MGRKKIISKSFCLFIFLSYLGGMKIKTKEKSNTVRLLDGNVLKEAKILSIKKGYDTLQEYVTEAVKEKNEKESKRL
jgi:hypothetical protein